MKTMSKAQFIRTVMSEVKDCVYYKHGRSMGDIIMTIPKLNLTERWIYDIYVNIPDKQIISHFIVRSNKLGRTEYETTNWMGTSRRWDSALKEFLEREVGIDA